MTRSFASALGLLAALAPAVALAQTNLDQGKSASQIFSAACVECHKSPHGLAKGKSADTVAEFLREHYTTSRDQAAALAAYVVGGRDTVATPLPGRKPPAQSATASTEDKEKPSRHQRKPEEGSTVNGKPARPSAAEAKPKEKEEASPGLLPGLLSPAVRSERESKPTTATRNRRKEPATPEQPQEPAAVAHVPPATAPEPPAKPESKPEVPAPEASPAPTASAPAQSEPRSAPSEPDEAAPRDNVPD